MNAPDSPLNPETLDELLSADIDGELAGAAADLGLSLAEATAAIAATPGHEARRAALARARGLIGTPPSLSAPAELRLVGAALARSTDELRALRDRPRRLRQALTAIGSAAAAAAVVAGVVVLASTNPGSSSKSSSTASLTVPQQGVASPTPRPGGTRLQSIKFGDVSNPRTLGAEIQTRLTIAARGLSPAELPPLAINGPVGGVGAAGGSGDTGLPGPIGPDGVTGPVGGTGAPGAQGLPDVVRGSGAQGATGPVGATGLVGPSPTGPTGAFTFELAGPAGVTGPQTELGIANANGPADDGLVGAKGATGPSARYSSNKSASDATAQRVHATSAEPACAAVIRRRAGIITAPVLTGTGTDAGIPAVIAVFARGHGYVVYVLAASDCSLLSRQILP